MYFFDRVKVKISGTIYAIITRNRAQPSDKFAKKLKLDYASFNIYVPYPGTESYEMLNKEGLIKTKDWSKYDQSFGELIYKNRNLEVGEIQHLIKKA